MFICFVKKEKKKKLKQNENEYECKHECKVNVTQMYKHCNIYFTFETKD